MKALLVVDVQNDFCPGGAVEVKNGDKVVPVINGLMDKFPVVLASRDWHPEKTVHFEKWPPHCMKETKGAEFHPDLNTSKINKVFLKGTGNADDGYSVFEATSDDFEKYVKENDIDELYVTGLATDYCVKNSAIDSSKAGVSTYIIEDAIKGVDLQEGDVDKAIQEMKDSGVKITSSSHIT